MSIETHRGAGPIGVTRVRAIVLGVMLALVVVFACSGTAAFALPEQGHEFSTAFSIPAEASLSEPAGIAVNVTSGDVYVVDRGHNRVERFSAGGTFLSAWGWGVKPGLAETKYGVCVSGEGCKEGSSKKPEPEAFKSPEAIAIDNSATSVQDPSRGDVYVAADPASGVIDKFGPNGEFLSTLTGKAEAKEVKEDGHLDGVSVDAEGGVWVARGTEAIYVTHFSNALVNLRAAGEPTEFSAESVLFRPGFAIGTGSSLYLNLEPGGTEEAKKAPCKAATPCFVARFQEEEGKAAAAGELELVPEIGDAFVEGLFAGETAEAVAVDLRNGEIYVAHETDVSSYAAGGGRVQTFGQGELHRAAGVAINESNEDVYVADAATGTIDVFGPEAAHQRPQVDEVAASQITSSTASLTAAVDPRGLETKVTFQYGTSSCANGGCTTLSPAPVPAGYGDVTRAVKIENLTPGATYHIRVVAENSLGTTTREQEFGTRPIALADGRRWEMVSPPEKNGAGYESIPYEGGLIESSTDGNAFTYLSTSPSEARAEGNRSPAFTQNLAKRTVGGNGEAQWVSKDIQIPGTERAPGVGEGQAQEYKYFTPDLSRAVVAPLGAFPTAEPSLAPPVAPGEKPEKTIYIRNNNEVCSPVPAPCYQSLVNAVSDTVQTKFGGPPAQPGSGLNVKAASPNLEHVVFESEVPLTAEPAETAHNNIYEWNSGPTAQSLKVVNLLPKLTAEEAAHPVVAQLGNKGSLVRNAVSENGTRIFFAAGGHVYMRDMTRQETIQLDVPQAGAPGGENEASFQTASVDGARVFFTDIAALVSGSRAKRGSPDLYEAELVSTEGQPATYKLSDLTLPQAGSEEAAAVRDLVVGADEAGESVYFVANGVLSGNTNAEGESAAPGQCPEEGETPTATCNLYVEHYKSGSSGEWERPVFIARLSSEDYPDYGGNNKQDLSALTASVSQNGHYLAFMTMRPLRHNYENTVTTAAAEGAHAEEVYLYNSVTRALVCASCNPSGAHPNAVLDQESAGEGLGLLVNRNFKFTWKNHWLAGNLPGWTQANISEGAIRPPRYLTNSGRLFFNSPDALVPADENGKEDVYQYEPYREGTCVSESGCVSLVSSGTSAQESAFLDASTTGNDVFLLTSAPLVPADQNPNFDVYDARVCEQTPGARCVEPLGGASPPCASSLACDGAAQTTAPALASPASGSITGPVSAGVPVGGVLPSKATKPSQKLTRAQQLAKALKTCKKSKQPHKRKACERAARKRYGPKKVVRKGRGR